MEEVMEESTEEVIIEDMDMITIMTVTIIIIIMMMIITIAVRPAALITIGMETGAIIPITAGVAHIAIAITMTIATSIVITPGITANFKFQKIVFK